MFYPLLFLFFAVFLSRNGSCFYNQWCEILKTEELLAPNIRMQAFIPGVTEFTLIVNDYVYTIPLKHFNPTIPVIHMRSSNNHNELLEGKLLNQSYFRQISQLMDRNGQPNIQLSYLALYTDHRPSPFNVLIDIILSDSSRHSYLQSSDGKAYRADSSILKNVPPNSNVDFRTVLWPFNDIRSGSYLLQRIDDESIRFYSLKELLHFSPFDDIAMLPWYSLRQINETHAKFFFLNIMPNEDYRIKSDLLSQISFGGIAKNHVILLDVTAEWIYVFPYVSLEKQDNAEETIPYQRVRFQNFFDCELDGGADDDDNDDDDEQVSANPGPGFSLQEAGDPAASFDFTDTKTIIVIVVLLIVVGAIITALALTIMSCQAYRNAVVHKSSKTRPRAVYKYATPTNVVAGAWRSSASARGPGIKNKNRKTITSPSSSQIKNSTYGSDAKKSYKKRLGSTI